LKKNIYKLVLLLSLVINAILIKEYIPLINHYESYWDLKYWFKKIILWEKSVDINKIYTSDKYVINSINNRSIEPKFNFKDILENDSLEEYQSSLKQQLINNFSLNNIQNVDIEYKIDSVIQYKSYTLKKISFQTQKNILIPAYILIPTNFPKPWNAVLVSHGCGYGKAGVAGFVDDIHNSIGIKLVQSGYLVFVHDRRGFGELQPADYYIQPSCGGNKIDGRKLLHYDTQSNFNTNLRSMDVNDMLVALNYLSNRNDVNKIGLIGLSGGGVVASYVSGLSDKVSCIVLSNSFGTFQEFENIDKKMGLNKSKKYIYPRTPNDKLKFYESIKYQSKYSENIDNMYLTPLSLLPKIPLLIQFGEDDTVSKKTRTELINYIRTIYTLFKSEYLLKISIEPNRGHEFISTPIIEFLNEHL